MEPLLQVNKLTVVFPGSEIPAVDQLSFELFPNETLGIVGESGSGKSATALALLNLLPKGTYVGGQILFYDSINEYRAVDLLSMPLSALSEYRGKKISIIFQDPMASLNPSMRCGKQVEEMIKFHFHHTANECKLQVLKLFEEVQLPHPEQIFYRYPHQLSGGQRQRVMIAMALASRPQILIADEPTTALDVTTQAEILSLLRNLQQRYSLSIIFISHDLRLVQHIANRVLVLRKGKLIEQGTNNEIFKKPREQYTQYLLNCRRSLHNTESPLPKSEVIQEIEKKIPSIIHNPAYDKPPLLEIRNLEVKLSSSRFLIRKNREKQILQQINLKLWEGETVGIVGESGSGKTTLGRALMQLIQTYKGEILFEGMPVRQLLINDRRDFYRKIQLIFQDPYSSLNPRMSIGELIREPLVVHNLIKTKREQMQRVYELLDAVRIDPTWYRRYPHLLSGGQRQRVAIARALALQPRVLICDECVSALDTSIAAQILNLLNELKEKYRLSYLFISHDLTLVRFMADRVIVLQKGQIVEENFTPQLFENPRHEYTQKLIQASL